MRSFPIRCFGEKPADRATPAPGFSIVSRRGALGSALADPRSVSNDPKVARPRLKTIDCQGDGVRRTVRSTNGRPHDGPRRVARGLAAERAPCLCSGLRLARPSQSRTSRASRATPLAGDPDPAWSGPSQPAASATGQRRHREERARVRAYVLPAGRHRSELGSCRTRPPAHVRAGGPPQTDAIRAPSDRRRSDARRAPSRSSPHRPLALDGHHTKPLGHRRRVAELRRVSSRAARPVRPRLQRQAERHH